MTSSILKREREPTTKERERYTRKKRKTCLFFTCVRCLLKVPVSLTTTAAVVVFFLGENKIVNFPETSQQALSSSSSSSVVPELLMMMMMIFSHTLSLSLPLSL